MVTDAKWFDIDNDKDLDLIVTGEWMGIEVLLNDSGKFKKTPRYKTLQNTKGWWNKVLVADIDNDGDDDIIAGNLGLNYKFHATDEKPFHVYFSDFDYNGTQDILLAKYYNNKQVPVRGKECTTQQMPHLQSKIKSYQDFASRDLEGIIGPSIKRASHYEVNEFRSGLFINTGNDNYSFQPFGNQVQQSPINSIVYYDFNGDSKKDLLLAGNNYQSEVETTRADSGIGNLLLGDGNGAYNSLNQLESGFFADKDVRDVVLINTGSLRLLLVINNNDSHDLFKLSH
jgi:hypothetical protein